MKYRDINLEPLAYEALNHYMDSFGLKYDDKKLCRKMFKRGASKFFDKHTKLPDDLKKLQDGFIDARLHNYIYRLIIIRLINR